MPKSTFFNLSSEKRQRVVEAFLREFATKTYDEASLSEVVKQLGIAKGSMYQYFDDKWDLFLFLIQDCTTIKQQFVGALHRSDFIDFWAYFRALYQQGYQFDLHYPMHSHFLHHLQVTLYSPSVKSLYEDMNRQAIQAFETMVSYEVQQGHFRQDIPITMMGYMLYKLGVNIQNYLMETKRINPLESIQNKQSVYQGKEALLMETVDLCIAMHRPAFDKNDNHDKS